MESQVLRTRYHLPVSFGWKSQIMTCDYFAGEHFATPLWGEKKTVGCQQIPEIPVEEPMVMKMYLKHVRKWEWYQCYGRVRSPCITHALARLAASSFSSLLLLILSSRTTPTGNAAGLECRSCICSSESWSSHNNLSVDTG